MQIQKQRQIQELVRRREELQRARGWVALSTKRKLGALQTHSEHYKYKHTQNITHTNTLGALQMQAHMDEKYRLFKHKQKTQVRMRD